MVLVPVAQQLRSWRLGGGGGYYGAGRERKPEGGGNIGGHVSAGKEMAELAAGLTTATITTLMRGTRVLIHPKSQGLVANHDAEFLCRNYCAPYTARAITLLLDHLSLVGR
eukprot:COSAG01_NODE_13640_length_1554_cov_7.951203_2_plen_111_part_00